MLMVNHSSVASSGDFPVGAHLMSSFTNVARPWCSLLVWPASMNLVLTTHTILLGT